MREIKFLIHAKDREGSIRHVILTIEELLDKGLKLPECEILAKRQYTALKDKNGKEIYEGDIVGYNDCQGYPQGDNKEVVSFCNKWCGFTPFCYPRFNKDNYPVEVIGNIYENSYLLEED